MNEFNRDFTLCTNGTCKLRTKCKRWIMYQRFVKQHGVAWLIRGCGAGKKMFIPMSKKDFDEEFEKMWEEAKARDKRDEEAWNALPEEEKRRREKMYSDSFYERISDDVTGDHDEG